MSIHPTAVVSDRAELGSDVSVGPFTVIESGVRVGDRCRIESRVSIKQGVVIGDDNQVCEGAVLGGMAQHLSPPEHAGGVAIGNGNVIREHSTVHRAMHAEVNTTIGDGCLLMVGAHVAHDCTVADHVVLTNNVLLGGHVTVGARAYVGGGVAVHQFCRVGRLAMIGGCARIIQDVPPFVMVDGSTGLVVGLNRVGLRRAGVTREEVRDLKEAYQIIYRDATTLEERLDSLGTAFEEGPAAEFAPFLEESKRGFIRERRSPPGGAIRPLLEDSEPATENKARWAG